MMNRRHIGALFAGFTSLLFFTRPLSAEVDVAAAAQQFRAKNPVVSATSPNTILCEAEEFQITSPGWKALNWGENYYAATFANCFLSRKAFLSAPAEGPACAATITIDVPDAGKYLALARYEAVYKFETQFRLVIEQNGAKKLDRLYGARKNPKIWAFSQKIKPEVAWGWGAVENVVWEGHDAEVQLEKGQAKLTLIAEEQPKLAAKRNVDLVMLTKDIAQVNERIEKESYLPLDGMLTQEGDLRMRVTNHAGDVKLTVTAAPCTEHSPYWIHIRNWKPIAIEVEPGKTSDWVEVGHLLDSLNDGDWGVAAAGPKSLDYTLEFGVPDGGAVASIATFRAQKPAVAFAYDANTRYTRRIRRLEQVLYDLVDFLKKHPVEGSFARRTLVYASTFNKYEDNPEYMRAWQELHQMLPTAPTDLSQPGSAEQPRGFIDVRDIGHAQLEEKMKHLQAEGLADKIAIVSLGDEIAMPQPASDDQTKFHAWLQAQGLTPQDVVPGAGDWSKIAWTPARETAAVQPRLFYFSKRYEHDGGISNLKSTTDLIKRYLPNAGIGANYSPHAANVYLGETHQWIDVFRKGGMTMPWSEDYIWQIPVGSQQMNFINVDLCRAAVRDQSPAKILYYVMPHWPGNNVPSWRRQWYGDIAHGVNIFNLFEFRPVQAAYTENHVNLPQMFLEVRKAGHELARFEDIVQDGRVRKGTAALWVGETADIWNDNSPPFGAAKRALYVSILHQQLPLDIVTEADAVAGKLSDYKVLYLPDRHVSRKGVKAIADWVAAGGQLMATVGAGLRDEFNEPNDAMADLLGIKTAELELPPEQNVVFIKQDLPHLNAMDTVSRSEGPKIDVYSCRGRFQATTAQVTGKFSDGSPAVASRAVGNGKTNYCGFLPGLSYFATAIPLRPVDRSSAADSMTHFIPTQFDKGASRLIGEVGDALPRPVTCSNPLVEASVLEAKSGTVVLLVNWTPQPVKGLKVTISLPLPKSSITRASLQPVNVVEQQGERTILELELDVADALIFR